MEWEVVPPGRLELPRPCGQQILSLPRLPIPPQGLTDGREGAHNSQGGVGVNRAWQEMQELKLEHVNSGLFAAGVDQVDAPVNALDFGHCHPITG